MKRKHLFLLFVLIGLLTFGIILVGCGDDDDDSGNNSSNGSNTNNTVLSGTWKRGCYFGQDNFGRDAYVAKSVEFAGNNHITNQSYYLNTACSDLIYKVKVISKFNIVDVILSNGLEAKKVSYTQRSFESTIFSPSMVTQLNTFAVCGKTNWEVNKIVDITDCAELSELPDYYLFKIDEDKLFFLDVDGTYDQNNFYTKE